MALKKTMILFLFLLFALNYNFVMADGINGEYKLERSMTDFIPNYSPRKTKCRFCDIMKK